MEAIGYLLACLVGIGMGISVLVWLAFVINWLVNLIDRRIWEVRK